VVAEAKPGAVPVFVVVAPWFVPVALFVSGAGAVPELVLVGEVHTNCADAGELADKAKTDSVAVAHSARVNAKADVVPSATVRRRRARALAANTVVDSAEREMRLRTTPAPV
jgi:hypothetical protein